MAIYVANFLTNSTGTKFCSRENPDCSVHVLEQWLLSHSVLLVKCCFRFCTLMVNFRLNNPRCFEGSTPYFKTLPWGRLSYVGIVHSLKLLNALLMCWDNSTNLILWFSICAYVFSITCLCKIRKAWLLNQFSQTLAAKKNMIIKSISQILAAKKMATFVCCLLVCRLGIEPRASPLPLSCISNPEQCFLKFNKINLIFHWSY